MPEDIKFGEEWMVTNVIMMYSCQLGTVGCKNLTKKEKCGMQASKC